MNNMHKYVPNPYHHKEKRMKPEKSAEMRKYE